MSDDGQRGRASASKRRSAGPFPQIAARKASSTLDSPDARDEAGKHARRSATATMEARRSAAAAIEGGRSSYKRAGDSDFHNRKSLPARTQEVASEPKRKSAAANFAAESWNRRSGGGSMMVDAVPRKSAGSSAAAAGVDGLSGAQRMRTSMKRAAVIGRLSGRMSRFDPAIEIDAANPAKVYRQNMLRRHVYSGAKLDLAAAATETDESDSSSPSPRKKNIRDVIRAVVKSTRKVLFSEKLVGTFVVGSCEKQVRERIAERTREALRDQDWDRFAQDLEDIQDEAHSLEIKYNGCVDFTEIKADLAVACRMVNQQRQASSVARQALKNVAEKMAEMEKNGDENINVDAENVWRTLLDGQDNVEEAQRKGRELWKLAVVLSCGLSVIKAKLGDAKAEAAEQDSKAERTWDCLLDPEATKAALGELPDEPIDRMKDMFLENDQEDESHVVDVCSKELQKLGAGVEETPKYIDCIRVEAFKGAADAAVDKLVAGVEEERQDLNRLEDLVEKVFPGTRQQAEASRRTSRNSMRDDDRRGSRNSMREEDFRRFSRNSMRDDELRRTSRNSMRGSTPGSLSRTSVRGSIEVRSSLLKPADAYQRFEVRGTSQVSLGSKGSKEEDHEAGSGFSSVSADSDHGNTSPRAGAVETQRRRSSPEIVGTAEKRPTTSDGVKKAPSLMGHAEAESRRMSRRGSEGAPPPFTVSRRSSLRRESRTSSLPLAVEEQPDHTELPAPVPEDEALTGLVLSQAGITRETDDELASSTQTRSSIQQRRSSIQQRRSSIQQRRSSIQRPPFRPGGGQLRRPSEMPLAPEALLSVRTFTSQNDEQGRLRRTSQMPSQGQQGVTPLLRVRTFTSHAQPDEKEIKNRKRLGVRPPLHGERPLSSIGQLPQSSPPQSAEQVASLLDSAVSFYNRDKEELPAPVTLGSSAQVGNGNTGVVKVDDDELSSNAESSLSGIRAGNHASFSGRSRSADSCVSGTKTDDEKLTDGTAADSKTDEAVAAANGVASAKSDGSPHTAEKQAGDGRRTLSRASPSEAKHARSSLQVEGASPSEAKHARSSLQVEVRGAQASPNVMLNTRASAPSIQQSRASPVALSAPKVVDFSGGMNFSSEEQLSSAEVSTPFKPPTTWIKKRMTHLRIKAKKKTAELAQPVQDPSTPAPETDGSHATDLAKQPSGDETEHSHAAELDEQTERKETECPPAAGLEEDSKVKDIPEVLKGTKAEDLSEMFKGKERRSQEAGLPEWLKRTAALADSGSPRTPKTDGGATDISQPSNRTDGGMYSSEETDSHHGDDTNDGQTSVSRHLGGNVEYDASYDIECDVDTHSGSDVNSVNGDDSPKTPRRCGAYGVTEEWPLHGGLGVALAELREHMETFLMQKGETWHEMADRLIQQRGDDSICLVTLVSTLRDTGFPCDFGELCLLFQGLGVEYCSNKGVVIGSDFVRLEQVEKWMHSSRQWAREAACLFRNHQAHRILIESITSHEQLIADVHLALERRGVCATRFHTECPSLSQALDRCFAAACGFEAPEFAEVVLMRRSIGTFVNVITSKCESSIVSQKHRELAVGILCRALEKHGGLAAYPAMQTAQTARGPSEDWFASARARSDVLQLGLEQLTQTDHDTGDGDALLPHDTSDRTASLPRLRVPTPPDDFKENHPSKMELMLLDEVWKPLLRCMDPDDDAAGTSFAVCGSLFGQVLALLRQTRLPVLVVGPVGAYLARHVSAALRKLQESCGKSVCSSLRLYLTGQGDVSSTLRKVLEAIDELAGCVGATAVHKLAAAFGGRTVMRQQLLKLPADADPDLVERGRQVFREWCDERRKLMRRWVKTTPRGNDLKLAGILNTLRRTDAIVLDDGPPPTHPLQCQPPPLTAPNAPRTPQLHPCPRLQLQGQYSIADGQLLSWLDTRMERVRMPVGYRCGTRGTSRSATRGTSQGLRTATREASRGTSGFSRGSSRRVARSEKLPPVQQTHRLSTEPS